MTGKATCTLLYRNLCYLQMSELVILVTELRRGSGSLREGARGQVAGTGQEGRGLELPLPPGLSGGESAWNPRMCDNDLFALMLWCCWHKCWVCELTGKPSLPGDVKTVTRWGPSPGGAAERRERHKNRLKVLVQQEWSRTRKPRGCILNASCCRWTWDLPRSLNCSSLRGRSGFYSHESKPHDGPSFLLALGTMSNAFELKSELTISTLLVLNKNKQIQILAQWKEAKQSLFTILG